MTTNEAISFLSQLKDILLNSNSWTESTKEPIKEAFSLAIHALEQLPSTPSAKPTPEPEEIEEPIAE